jgi:GNAT superfamily N-acetyltransferase
MTILRTITPQIAADYKKVRLRALRDTPSAFGSTYVGESQFTEADWITRAQNLCQDRSIGYLAFAHDQYCGIAAAFLDKQNPQTAGLVSMWVAPDHRRSGVGSTLIHAIQTWAISRGANTLQLMVTSSNHAAIAFYTRGASP